MSRSFGNFVAAREAISCTLAVLLSLCAAPICRWKNTRVALEVSAFTSSSPAAMAGFHRLAFNRSFHLVSSMAGSPGFCASSASMIGIALSGEPEGASVLAIDVAIVVFDGSARQMRRLYAIALSLSPFAVYASAALFSAMMLVGSFARIDSEMAMIESVGAGFIWLYAVRMHRRLSVDAGEAARPICAAFTAWSYLAARRSFVQVLYGPMPFSAAVTSRSTSFATSPASLPLSVGRG